MLAQWVVLSTWRDERALLVTAGPAVCAAWLPHMET